MSSKLQVSGGQASAPKDWKGWSQAETPVAVAGVAPSDGAVRSSVAFLAEKAPCRRHLP
jgi:hypothetical protein